MIASFNRMTRRNTEGARCGHSTGFRASDRAMLSRALWLPGLCRPGASAGAGQPRRDWCPTDPQFADLPDPVYRHVPPCPDAPATSRLPPSRRVARLIQVANGLNACARILGRFLEAKLMIERGRFHERSGPAARGVRHLPADRWWRMSYPEFNVGSRLCWPNGDNQMRRWTLAGEDWRAPGKGRTASKWVRPRTGAFRVPQGEIAPSARPG